MQSESKRPALSGAGRPAPVEPRLAVIGLGLVGGSILRGAVAHGLAADVRGWDGSPAALGAARAAGFGEFLAPTLEAACRGATLAAVAVPVREIPALVDRVRRLLAPTGGVVTDTGSTKQWVVAEVDRLAAAGGRADGEGARPRGPDRLAPYVAGHPIAGSERSGFGASRDDLFQGQSWVLVIPEAGPAPEVDPGPGAGPAPEVGFAALERVSAFVRGLGAEPLVTTAFEHDRALAVTSHLPYVLAASLAALAEATVGPEDRVTAAAGGAADGREGAASAVARVAPFVAGGFRDFTRLALQDPAMGSDMLATNAEEIERALAGLVEATRRFLDAAAGRGARPGLCSSAALRRARAFRGELGRLKRWR